ncbi:urease accessory protein UreF [Blochmannia endosymbiont of Colobopsis nipponica]|uniref:urease accessory protein UreF n=1 Tax=Blochmannia endosymbiont of Colobopsis nipponica TaxID=2681987 RepID=UPI001786DC1C|nr:urease accessory UreF family protein [Blochmannia endosymbiont of Colobopsis nipponica]QOI10949.1 urease accessory protein UreF [Blochmannia endosymbiont of Colobopsis nipponica]
MNKIDNCSLLHLMQLTSSFFPSGGFAYSQGLESAVKLGWLNSTSEFEFWQTCIINEQLTYLDWPMLKRMYFCIQNNDHRRLLFYVDQLLSFRETFELRMEEKERGRALVRLITHLSFELEECWLLSCQNSILASISWLGCRWKIPLNALAMGYAYVFIENLVTAGLKLIPFGQVSAQKFLMNSFKLLPDAWQNANLLTDDELGSSFPLQSIASSYHEIQKFRLFRS